MNRKRPHECTFHFVFVEDEAAAVVAAAVAVLDALASAFGAFAVAVAAVVAHAGAVFEVAAPAAAASLFHGDAALVAVSLGNVLVEVAVAVAAVVDAEAIVVDVGVSSPAMGDLPG
jgi:hypothetical protein